MNEYLLIDAYCTLSLAAAGLVFLFPFILGIVRRNPWFGIRSAKTFSSGEVWREINRRSALRFLTVLFPVLAIGAAMAFVGMNYQVPDSPFNYLWFVPLCLVAPLAFHTLLKKMVWTKKLVSSTSHPVSVYPFRRRAVREK